MKVVICIGSSCHLKGSRQIVQTLQKLVADYSLKDKVELAGTFCMGSCQEGVCVKIGERQYSLKPETVEGFFKSEILAKV